MTALYTPSTHHVSYNRHHWLECFKYYCNLIGHIIIFIFWLAKLWDKVRNYSHFIHSAQAFLSKPNEVMAKHIVERDNRWGFLVKDRRFQPLFQLHLQDGLLCRIWSRAWIRGWCYSSWWCHRVSVIVKTTLVRGDEQ